MRDRQASTPLLHEDDSLQTLLNSSGGLEPTTSPLTLRLTRGPRGCGEHGHRAPDLRVRDDDGGRPRTDDRRLPAARGASAAGGVRHGGPVAAAAGRQVFDEFGSQRELPGIGIGVAGKINGVAASR